MKIKHIKNDKILRFKDVTMREATVMDEKKAVNMARGKDEGYEFLSALISLICTFDGKPIVPEDVMKLSREDFLELVVALTGKSREDLQKMSSNLQDTEK